MATNFSGSAKIYAFPPRGRFAPANQGGSFSVTADAFPAAGVKIASGSAWYHDEAIAQEINAEPRRKN
jgi:hypothetical protein